MALSLGACAPVEQQTPELGRPLAPGKALIAGVGDVVLDLRLKESLPNAFGKADIFGRTREAGRVVVRYVGSQAERGVLCQAGRADQ